MAISISLNGEIFEQVIYSKEDAFEQLVSQNAQTIFGDKTIYIDAKTKLSTSSLGGTIPDGFLIDLSDLDNPQFYLVEVELQSHDFFKHIFPQITKFITSCKNPKHRQEIVDVLFSLSIVKDRIRALIGSIEVFKFLKDTIDSNPNILIIIDGPKAEFKEMMDTHTDWGRMIKVQIVNHFRRNDNNILTVETPFQKVSPPPGKERQKTLSANVKDMYVKIEKTFLNIKKTLKLNPTKNYIGVVDRKRIAYIQPKGKKVHLIVLMAENEVKEVLRSKHHEIVSFSESRQRTWGGKNPCCGLDIYDIDHWDEIEKLIARLVEKYQET